MIVLFILIHDYHNQKQYFKENGLVIDQWKIRPPRKMKMYERYFKSDRLYFIVSELKSFPNNCEFYIRRKR